jgi:small-conductance mechanosensitive channel
MINSTNASNASALRSSTLIDIGALYTILYLVIAIAIVVTIYVIVKKVLKRLRQRSVISRRVEGMIELVVLTITIITVIPLVLASYVQQSLLFSIVILGAALVALIIAFRDYIANVAGYITVISSGIVKDGDRVRVVINGVSYEGKVELLDNGFVQLTLENNVAVYIPYRQLLNATIVKYRHPLLKLNIRFRGHGIDIVDLVERVEEILKGSESVAEVYEAKPLEVHEEYVTVHTEVGLKKDSSTFLVELYRKLSSEMQYRFEVEVL